MIRPTTDSHRRGHRSGGLFIFCLSLWTCGPTAAPSPTLSVSPTPGPELLPQARTVYRQAGLLVGEGRFAPIGRLDYLPGPLDSTLAILSFALPNNALKFRREAPGYVARYRVHVSVGDTLSRIVELESNEEVRVATFRETSRRDVSVIYQSFFTLPPGRHTTRIVLDGLAFSAGLKLDTLLSVPAFDGPAVAGPILVYRAEARAERGARPDLIVSPHATIEFGTGEKIGAYIETLAISDTSLLLEILQEGAVISTERVTMRPTADPDFAAATLSLGEPPLPPGTLTVRVHTPEAGAEGRSRMFVSLGAGWVLSDYNEALSYLRYAGNPEELTRLRNAEPVERARLLQRLLERRDTDPETPENEFLRAYLRRLQDANSRFHEPGTPGWLTDRGAVYASLGPPDDVIPGLHGQEEPAGSRIWVYDRAPDVELRLIFVDRSGNGNYRLTAESRAAFQRAVQRSYP